MKDLYKSPLWVCWKLEERGDKKTKIPKQVNGYNASSNKPETWTTYDNAIKAAEKLNFSGVGVVLGDVGYGGLCGIDFDHVRNSETGYIIPEVLELIKQLDSYTEISPSGTGLHVLLYVENMDAFGGKTPVDGWENPAKDGETPMLEYYMPKLVDGIITNGRYFTVTNNVYNNNNVVNVRTSEMKALMNKHPVGAIKTEKKENVKEVNSVNPVCADLSQEVIKGLTFNKRLYALYKGEIGTMNPSDADFSFTCECIKLCNFDIPQVRTLWYQSALSKREKNANRPELWEKYTLQNALTKVRAEKGQQSLNASLSPVETELSPEEKKARVMNDSGTNYLNNLLKDLESRRNETAISTGFRRLDYDLDGGFYSGLYVLMSGSSNGKSAIALQMCDAIAKQGKDVMIASLEMSGAELVARSISRISHEIGEENEKKRQGALKSDAFKIRDIITPRAFYDIAKSANRQTLLNQSMTEYIQYADHIFIKEAVGDYSVSRLKEDVKQHIEVTGNVPVIVCDYLQILAPEESVMRASDKQVVDKAMLELMRLSRQYNAVVICISSIARDKYIEDISMDAAKESGSIEYGASCVLGLMPILKPKYKYVKASDEFKLQKPTKQDLEEWKRFEDRGVKIKILKNRNGKAGGENNYVYYSPYNRFEETKSMTDKELIAYLYNEEKISKQVAKNIDENLKEQKDTQNHVLDML